MKEKGGAGYPRTEDLVIGQDLPLHLSDIENHPAIKRRWLRAGQASLRAGGHYAGQGFLRTSSEKRSIIELLSG